MTANHTYKISDEPIVKGFLKSISAYPTNNALWVNDCYYSYEQLAQIVLSIYKKIPADKNFERIGIYCNDDVYTYAGILAINLYGAAYVPLNNKFPVAKNKNIVEQCELKLILSSVENEYVKNISGDTSVTIIGHSELVSESFNDLYSYNKTKNKTAYILFTSGSTGEPKGVPISNVNVNSFFDSIFKNYNFTEKDKFLQASELTFDFSVFSFFMPLYIGACCYVIPDNEIKFVKIIQMLMKHKITVLSMVPTILKYIEKYFAEIKLPDLRYTFFSGDALYHDLAAKWGKVAPNGYIYNCYGTTETTVICTQYLFDENKSSVESVNGVVPLGKSFPGMDVLIVDEKNGPTEKGEICFSGPQVVTDYLNNSSEEKFFTNNGKRYYKPGDIASYNLNGDLIFLGRRDNQVKINGYRVELVEIEFAIEKATNKKCVVICSKDEKQLNTLTAFIETTQLNEKDLINQLLLALPDFMVPQKFIAVEKFPLNINEKVDKNKLLFLHK